MINWILKIVKYLRLIINKCWNKIILMRIIRLLLRMTRWGTPCSVSILSPRRTNISKHHRKPRRHQTNISTHHLKHPSQSGKRNQNWPPPSKIGAGETWLEPPIFLRHRSHLNHRKIHNITIVKTMAITATTSLTMQPRCLQWRPKMTSSKYSNSRWIPYYRWTNWTGANKLTMQIKVENQTAAKVQIERKGNNSTNKKVKAIKKRSKERIVWIMASKTKMTSKIMIPLCSVFFNSWSWNQIALLRLDKNKAFFKIGLQPLTKNNQFLVKLIITRIKRNRKL